MKHDARDVYELMNEWSDGTVPLFDEDVNPRAYDFVTYEVYCEALDLVLADRLTEGYFAEAIARDALNEGFWGSLKDKTKAAVDYVKALPGKLVGFFKEVKAIFEELATRFKADISDMIEAIKQRDVFGAIKAFGFSLGKIVKAVHEALSILRKGLMNVFEEIANSGVVQKLRSGAIKVDEFFDQHPILKKVGGVALAGLLLFIWLHSTLLGDVGDFDMGVIGAALVGSFSITDLFTTPSGIAMLALFVTGMTGLSGIAWFGTATNIVIGLVYTGLVKLKSSPTAHALAQKLRTTIKV